MSVLTPPILEQLTRLKGDYAEASWQALPNGTVLVTVPAVDLPKEWMKERVKVRFVLPVGYPNARPDCFWTEADLRLIGSRTPKNTGANQIPGAPPENLLWFSWHIQGWSPNDHTVLTWMRVIKKRFELFE
jgi:hypothetical protein